MRAPPPPAKCRQSDVSSPAIPFSIGQWLIKLTASASRLSGVTTRPPTLSCRGDQKWEAAFLCSSGSTPPGLQRSLSTVHHTAVIHGPARLREPGIPQRAVAICYRLLLHPPRMTCSWDTLSCSVAEMKMELHLPSMPSFRLLRLSPSTIHRNMACAECRTRNTE